MIVNADDFGLCPSVNKAIKKAHTEGILTSTTLMANMLAASQAVEMAKNLPDLGVGIHLNLTEGSPLSTDDKVKCLTDQDGQFANPPGRLAFNSICNSRFKEAIKIELTAQIKWAIAKGINPTHLDSHKHIHSFPSIFPIICKLAASFGIPSIRWTFESRKVTGSDWPSPAKTSRINAFKIRNMARINSLQNKRFFKNNVFFGAAHTGRINQDFWKAVAKSSFTGVAEVMTHPGYTEDLDPKKTRLIKEREIELQALCSRETKKYLNDAEIKLVHYGQI